MKASDLIQSLAARISTNEADFEVFTLNNEGRYTPFILLAPFKEVDGIKIYTLSSSLPQKT